MVTCDAPLVISRASERTRSWHYASKTRPWVVGCRGSSALASAWRMSPSPVPLTALQAGIHARITEAPST